MSHKNAHTFAYSLAITLMVSIIVFPAGYGSLSVVLANEFDGNAKAILSTIAPFP